MISMYQWMKSLWVMLMVVEIGSMMQPRMNFAGGGGDFIGLNPPLTGQALNIYNSFSEPEYRRARTV